MTARLLGCTVEEFCRLESSMQEEHLTRLERRVESELCGWITLRLPPPPPPLRTISTAGKPNKEGVPTLVDFRGGQRAGVEALPLRGRRAQQAPVGMPTDCPPPPLGSAVGDNSRVVCIGSIGCCGD